MAPALPTRHQYLFAVLHVWQRNGSRPISKRSCVTETRAGIGVAVDSPPTHKDVYPQMTGNMFVGVLFLLILGGVLFIAPVAAALYLHAACMARKPHFMLSLWSVVAVATFILWMLIDVSSPTFGLFGIVTFCAVATAILCLVNFIHFENLDRKQRTRRNFTLSGCILGLAFISLVLFYPEFGQFLLFIIVIAFGGMNNTRIW